VYDADFRGRIEGAKRQSMTSVGEVTAEEGRGRKWFFSAPSRDTNRQSLAYETSMVPQDHCQRTSFFPWTPPEKQFLNIDASGKAEK
jgi:hypothetical protein